MNSLAMIISLYGLERILRGFALFLEIMELISTSSDMKMNEQVKAIKLNEAGPNYLMRDIYVSWTLNSLTKVRSNRAKKNSCFRKCRWREKSSPRLPQIYFFNWFSGDIFFSFLVSFACFVFLFFLLVCLFFEIKNIYSDTYSTLRVGEW